MSNTDIDGIHYGVISGNSLDPEVLQELQVKGDNLTYLEWRADKGKEIANEVQDEVAYGLPRNWSGDREDEIERRLEEASEGWEGDECVYEGTKDGIKYRLSWLGGAPLVWALAGLRAWGNRLCSPCVPGAVDLDGGWTIPRGDEEVMVGFPCWAVPKDWLGEHVQIKVNDKREA